MVGNSLINGGLDAIATTGSLFAVFGDFNGGEKGKYDHAHNVDSADDEGKIVSHGKNSR